MRCRVVLTIALGMVLSHVANALPQSPEHSDVATAAGAAYDSKDWEKAAKLYGELAKSQEAPPRVWLRLGASLRELKRFHELPLTRPLGSSTLQARAKSSRAS